MTAGKKYKIRPDGDGGWRTVTPPCREYTFSRSFPESQVVAAIPEGTVIGPVLEVRTVKILDEHGMEIAIPSIIRLANTSHVVISRETERLVIFMITKKSSGPVTNCSQLREDPTAARRLARALPAILLVILCSRKTVIPGGEG